MQIAPGQAPLSLAVLKALGSQAAAPAAKASPAPAAAGPTDGTRGSAAGDAGAATRHLPRGSLVDLRA